MKRLAVLAICAALSGCGVVYFSPDVAEETTEAGVKVRVVPLTAETTIVANRSPYTPRSLPDGLGDTLQVSALGRVPVPAPDPVLDAVRRPDRVETRLPPEPAAGPYMIGVGDVLLFASPSSANTVEQLSGLLAAQNARQGYTVQDDGAVAIPNVGRVQVAGLTLEEAEAALFERLVAAGIEPVFSIEIAEFGSQRVAVGGAVGSPSVVPLGLTPLTLGEALLRAGGIAAPAVDYAIIRIYRDGSLYQVPANEFLARPQLQRLRLVNGDSVYVDTSYDLDRAEAYFGEQIRLAEFRRSSRATALEELEAEVNVRQAALEERRRSFDQRLDLGAVDRDYVYLTGEVARQTRVPLPFEGRATLADVLYSEGGFSTRDGNPGQIYVLRGSDDPAEFSGLTAYNLDGRQAANLLLATRFEMRPNDIVFIAEQPVTRWNRAVSLIVPNVVTLAATGN